jgi:molybdenum-dependent DNA-binding transcriptional regulator ModE
VQMDKYNKLHSQVVRPKPRPCVSFEFENGRVTERELRALASVDSTGSQLEAAKALGISIPVLHRRLSSAEAKVGAPIVETFNRGTRLTQQGTELVHAFEEYNRRTTPPTTPVIACSPIMRQRVHNALSIIEREYRRTTAIVSDDEMNMRLFLSGQVDLLILDDPIFAYESLREHPVKEIGKDTLLMVDRGPSFARYRYGPQRLGFEYLKQEEIEHEEVRFISNIDAILDEKLSFFVNNSMAYRKGLNRRSLSIKPIVEFSILAVIHEDSQSKVSGILNALSRQV